VDSGEWIGGLGLRGNGAFRHHTTPPPQLSMPPPPKIESQDCAICGLARPMRDR
jgi:hypothetical protein